MARLVIISLVALVFLGTGCGSRKQTQRGGSEISYKSRKAFEQVFFEANKEKVLNNKEKALELYKSALAIYPGSHATMYQLAKLNYQLDSYSDALMWSEKAVKTSSEYNHWYYGQLGQFYNKFGKYAKSAEIFSKMIDMEPDVRSNYKEAASQYYNAKMFDKSVSTLKRMQAKFGIEHESSSRLEYVYSAIGEKEKALEVMKELSEHYPDDIRYLGILAESYMVAGHKDKAIATLGEVIALEPTSGKAYYALYSIYSKSNDDALAIANLKKAFGYDGLSLQQKMQAVSGYFLNLKSDSVLRFDMYELSDILLDKYPEAVEPHLLKSDIYGSLGEYTKARGYLRKALLIDGSDFKLWGKLLGVNARINDEKAQLEDVGHALELFPNMASLYVTKGYAQLNLKQHKNAVETADEGLDLATNKRDETELLLCKASALQKLKKHTQSDKTYDQLLKINSRNTTVINNYSFSLAERKTRLDFADSLISIALRLEPSNPYFMDTKGWVLYGKGDYEAAIKAIQKCILIDPNSIEYYKHAKAIYIALGNKTMANDMQQKIDKLNEK